MSALNSSICQLFQLGGRDYPMKTGHNMKQQSCGGRFGRDVWGFVIAYKHCMRGYKNYFPKKGGDAR